ncbi:MAG TPA: hypothetical protein VFV79_05045 [Saprospiraceae bacterium]|nr:hypothetical protein [Saprospiraceae bacterium]
MLRYFKNPAPVREISLVSLKSFPKTRLLKLMKETILKKLPYQVTQQKSVKRMGVEITGSKQ